MKAEIKRIHSPDVDDLTNFNPSDPENFSFLLQVIIGPKGEEGEESFDIEVCTPKWLDQNINTSEVIIGRHYLFVSEYNLSLIMDRINSFIETCEGDSWHEIAVKIGRLGKWEFEDYVD